MSLRVVVSLVSLLSFVGFAAAGVAAPDCSTTWQWSFNTLGQNACTVAAFLISTCHGGSFTVDALPAGYHYAGPTTSQATDLCQCNTVAYSLLSACDACQGADFVSYASFTGNCSKVLAPKSFPNPVPDGTRVPFWALVDVTTTGGVWDPVKAAAVGDAPEAGPGAKIGSA